MKYNSKLFYVTIFCILQNVVSVMTLPAQNASNTVAVVPFSMSFEQDNDYGDYSRMLTETVLTAIVQTQRFMMVDQTDMEKVLNIRKQQDPEKEDYKGWQNISDARLITAGKQLGVQYIFTGNISNVAISPTVSGLYRSEFGFTTKVISVETGRIYVTETFSINSDKGITGRFGGKDSQREALNAALQNVGEPFKKFIDKYFPIQAKYFKLKESNKKGLPELIIVEGGLTQGLRKDQKLDLVIIDTAKNSTYKDKIGEVKIVDIESNFATCKVLEGASALGEAIKNSAERLVVQSQASN